MTHDERMTKGPPLSPGYCSSVSIFLADILQPGYDRGDHGRTNRARWPKRDFGTVAQSNRKKSRVSSNTRLSHSLSRGQEATV
jgi:hypothetical protein